ncbi:hypothetical protein ARMGADRAFT_818647 [Armillaria gallica]|uniref:Uncharacterized protein n=1 Tax=Armillaria gallica TaxID=47427 RepID=A0A2H3CGB5_ARMGA|nr:hypothetical protein ARMGADRAFT_818647 [Armillaria gallica]
MQVPRRPHPVLRIYHYYTSTYIQLYGSQAYTLSLSSNLIYCSQERFTLCCIQPHTSVYTLHNDGCSIALESKQCSAERRTLIWPNGRSRSIVVGFNSLALDAAGVTFFYSPCSIFSGRVYASLTLCLQLPRPTMGRSPTINPDHSSLRDDKFSTLDVYSSRDFYHVLESN